MRGGPPARTCPDREPPLGASTRLRRSERRPDATHTPETTRLTERHGAGAPRGRAASPSGRRAAGNMSVEPILETHPRALIANLGVLASSRRDDPAHIVRLLAVAEALGRRRGLLR